DVVKVAKQYPDTTFAIVDSSAADSGANNLTGLLFAENERSFLAGAASPLKTETNHIGFVGGVHTQLIHKVEASHVAGAKPVKGGQEVINDLKTDGVGLATSGRFIDDIKDQIDGYRQKIVAGEIKVPTQPWRGDVGLPRQAHVTGHSRGRVRAYGAGSRRRRP